MLKFIEKVSNMYVIDLVFLSNCSVDSCSNSNYNPHMENRAFVLHGAMHTPYMKLEAFYNQLITFFSFFIILMKLLSKYTCTFINDLSTKAGFSGCSLVVLLPASYLPRL